MTVGYNPTRAAAAGRGPDAPQAAPAPPSNGAAGRSAPARASEGARAPAPRHSMIQPLVELYGGCMMVLKVS
jgi:hypothetical protein